MSQLFQITKLKLTQYITSISLIYKNWRFYLEVVWFIKYTWLL